MMSYHIPVLLKESLDLLNLRSEGLYVDATLGGGGHSRAILEMNPTVKLYAFDRDKDAIDYNQALVEKYSDRFKMFNDNFVNFRTRLALERIPKIDGILLDLGVSSYQINTSERGLSFDLDGDLDMRMNRNDELTAYDVVNNYSVAQLTEIFREFGEEREAFRIAKGISNQRKLAVIKTTAQLAEIIDRSTSSPFKIKAKARVFQGLRIYINGELEALKSVLADAVEMLNPTGRIVVISYHSLEDRLVKRFFNYEEQSCICPNKFPKCICDKQSRLKILTKKPMTPAEEELESNRRSRSAKLRAAEKL